MTDTPGFSRRYPLVLVALIVLAYSNSLHGPFVFDDIVNIVENQSIRSLLPPWKPLFADSGRLSNRPLLNVSLALNYSLSGLNVPSYHLVNLLIHIAAALLLFDLLRRIFLQVPLLSPNRAPSAATASAFAVAALWALNPLQTQAVTYVIQRGESMAGMFSLLTLYCSVRARESQAGLWPIGAVLAFFAGVGSKETSGTIPFLTVLMHVCLFGDSVRDWVGKNRTLVFGFTAGLVYLVLQLAFSGGSASDVWNLQLPPLMYILIQAEVIRHYLGLVFLPTTLCFDYGFSLPEPHVLLVSFMLIGGLALLGLWWLKRRPHAGFAVTAFFALLAPTSLIPLQDIANEHRLYPASILPLALAVVVIERLRWNRLKVGLLITALLATGILTFRRNQDYRDEITLWQATQQVRPQHWRANQNLGLALLKADRPQEAHPWLARAAFLNPPHPHVPALLGIVLIQLGQFPEAVLHLHWAERKFARFPQAGAFITELQKHPERDRTKLSSEAKVILYNYLMIHANLGRAFFHQNRMEAAQPHLRNALSLEPDGGLAQHWLDLLHRAQSREADPTP